MDVRIVKFYGELSMFGLVFEIWFVFEVKSAHCRGATGLSPIRTLYIRTNKKLRLKCHNKDKCTVHATFFVLFFVEISKFGFFVET